MKKLAARFRLPGLIVLGGLVVAAIAACLVKAKADREASDAYARNVEQLAAQVRAQFQLPLRGLKGLAGLYAANERVGREQFRRFLLARDMSADFPGVHGFSFVERVPREALPAFIAAERADGAPDFKVRQLNASAHDDLFVVKFIEPAASNQGAEGLDIGSEPRRRRAAELAISSGKPILSEPIDLVQEQQRRLGFLLYLPVFRSTAMPATPENSQQTVLGLLGAAIVVAEALGPLAEVDEPELQFRLLDTAGRPDTATVLFDSAAARSPSSPPERADSAGPRFTSVRSIQVPGRMLRLEVRSTPHFDGLSNRHAAWAVAASIFLSSLLLAGLISQQLLARLRAERDARRLAADRDRLALVAERTINAVIIADTQRRIVWVNAAFEQITGYTSAEVIGRSPGGFLQYEKTDPTTVARVRAALKAGLSFRGEIRNRGKTGREYWLDLDVQPLRDSAGALTGFMAVETDITTRREAEDEARRSASLLRGAIDAMDDAFVVFDKDERLVLCNEKYRTGFPGSVDTIQPGVQYLDIIRAHAESGQQPEAIGRVDAWLAERLAAFRQDYSVLIHRLSDGRVLRVVDRKLPDGSRIGFRTDITDLIKAKELAEQSQRAQAQFIATVSHELRTPLQTINGFSDLGRVFAAAYPPLQGMFEDIHAGGTRMLKLVNGLLDVSKIDRSMGSIELRRADVAALAAEVADELAAMANRNSLRIALPETLPCLMADVDAFRMQQVVRNVLANAIQYAPAGSEIELAFSGDAASGAEITVRDRGPGIPTAEMETIFDAFVQSSRTRDGSGGTGLGLAISRQIMAAHGGSIKADNAPAGGALMRVKFPPAQGQPTSESPQAELVASR